MGGSSGGSESGRGMRRCRKCGQAKALAAFTTAPAGAKSYTCRGCANRRNRERRARLKAREEIPTPEEKACAECGETKPAEEFYACAANLDGRRGKCKVCHDVLPCRTPGARHEARRRAAEREGREFGWKSDPRDRARKRLARRTERRPGIAPGKARQVYRAALQSGMLIKPDHCVRCGKTPPSDQLHGHHDDYEYPLSVRWLCLPCHQRVHGMTPSELESEDQRAYWRRYQRKRRWLHRRRSAARRAVQRAVEAGRVSKPPACEGCGRDFPPEELHGHHYQGYDRTRRLRVRWLCVECHVAAEGGWGRQLAS